MSEELAIVAICLTLIGGIIFLAGVFVGKRNNPHFKRIERKLDKIMADNHEQELALDAKLVEVKTTIVDAVATAADRVIAALQAAQTANNIDLSDEIGGLEEFKTGVKTALDAIAPVTPPV